MPKTMETKHTKEYAEKMYLKQLDEFKEVGFTDGYMKAIEETNVAELLDVLKMLVNKVDEIVEEENMELTDDDKYIIEKSKIAIKKAQ